MALYNFRNGADTLHYIAIHRTAFEVQTNVSTRGIAKTLRVYVEAAAYNYAIFDKVLNTLVYCCARYTTLCCYIFKWDTSVLRQDTQYLSV